MSSRRAAGPLIMLAAVTALFFPSSVGGVISPVLDRVSIILNVALFAALLLVGRCHGSRLQAAIGVCVVAWLSLLTVLSPQAEVATGLMATFGGLALMLSTNVQPVVAPRAAARMLAVINLVAFTVGPALLLDLSWANQVIKTWYAAFYPELLVSMLDWHHKPVLMFATHSVAGFFYYLFFYLNVRRYVVSGSRVGLVAAIGHIVLGFALRSTTGYLLMTIATVQLLVALWRRHGRTLAWLAVVAPLLIVGVVLLQWERLVASVAPVRELVVGTPEAGLAARYAETGLLEGNLRYINDAPFSPIGFNYAPSPDLFYGDSGLIQLMLRGSVPLVLLVYGGLYGFLRANLRHRTDVRWLFVVTLLFEMGYTPLFHVRVTSFLPFLVVYLNGLPSPDHEESPRQGV